MNAVDFGNTLTALRKKCGLTQQQLAEKLFVSNKTISRWENGLGFPEVPMFPVLAEVLGVSVDYLMAGKRKGITIVGSIITDAVKNIDCYPEMGMLATISSISIAAGGCAPNTAIDLAKIDRRLPVGVIGRIGNDDYGRFILSQFDRYGVNSDMVKISPSGSTSFCDVMSLSSGERTFFHNRGTNAEFSPEDVDLSTLNCSIMHFGYLLLLDVFDQPDKEYGTVLARFLNNVQKKGIKTSIDVVSNSSADYKATIVPALKYCNYAFMNEIECCRITGLNPRSSNGEPNVENIKKTMLFMAECGVKDKVIIHCKELGFCYDVKTETFTIMPSLKIPKEEIMGSVGAGDAFCAGSLYGLYNEYSDADMLKFAAATAASSLFKENSTDGVLDRDSIFDLMKKYGG
ncbi:MAG: helix-turn-helix domain-containing protein [Clostridia bacterium]|nr:helix-turn-helix domain-containing protein [Clostridia bacterium]